MCNVTEIELPHANHATISPCELIHYFAIKHIANLRIGAEQVCYANLKHRDTLERWIRDQPAVAEHRDTMQAVNSVVATLCNTGLFHTIQIRNGLRGRNPVYLRCTVLPQYENA